MSGQLEERLQARELRRQDLLDQLRRVSKDRATLCELTGASVGNIRRALAQETYLRRGPQPVVVKDELAPAPWRDRSPGRKIRRAEQRRSGDLKPRRPKSGLNPRRSPMRFEKLAKAGTLRKELRS